MAESFQWPAAGRSVTAEVQTAPPAAASFWTNMDALKKPVPATSINAAPPSPSEARFSAPGRFGETEVPIMNKLIFPGPGTSMHSRRRTELSNVQLTQLKLGYTGGAGSSPVNAPAGASAAWVPARLDVCTR